MSLLQADVVVVMPLCAVDGRPHPRCTSVCCRRSSPLCLCVLQTGVVVMPLRAAGGRRRCRAYVCCRPSSLSSIFHWPYVGVVVVTAIVPLRVSGHRHRPRCSTAAVAYVGCRRCHVSAFCRQAVVIVPLQFAGRHRRQCSVACRLRIGVWVVVVPHWRVQVVVFNAAAGGHGRVAPCWQRMCCCRSRRRRATLACSGWLSSTLLLMAVVTSHLGCVVTMCVRAMQGGCVYRRPVIVVSKEKEKRNIPSLLSRRAAVVGEPVRVRVCMGMGPSGYSTRAKVPALQHPWVDPCHSLYCTGYIRRPVSAQIGPTMVGIQVHAGTRCKD